MQLRSAVAFTVDTPKEKINLLEIPSPTRDGEIHSREGHSQDIPSLSTFSFPLLCVYQQPPPFSTQPPIVVTQFYSVIGAENGENKGHPGALVASFHALHTNSLIRRDYRSVEAS